MRNAIFFPSPVRSKRQDGTRLKGTDLAGDGRDIRDVFVPEPLLDVVLHAQFGPVRLVDQVQLVVENVPGRFSMLLRTGTAVAEIHQY